ncbi:cell division protein FtsL [Geobacter sp. DSM 9736]|uniref:cell division protein FtsL n=1 Tax=Geobacter sp. DSM 9736 TaxID=1277350 RepID=UPI000B5108AE|nr:cell division protein FtsL [Geobacter sp. DSM 9736]SNB47810.1 cell division protein FtsL [Geobacter sp. DSM 9736]
MADVKTIHSKVAAPRKVVALSAQKWDLFPYLIVIMVLLTVVSVFHVWSRVRVIDLNLAISEARRQVKDQHQENSRLKLEVASLKTPARIEAFAKEELGMRLPLDQQVVVVK